MEKRWLVIGLLVGLAGVAEAKGPGPAKRAEAQRHFDAAIAHYKAQEFAEAVDEFEAAYKLRPEPEWLYNLGQACRLARQLDKALDYYQKYLAEVPDAENRPAVEQRIAEVEKQRAAAKAAAPPPSAPATPPMAERAAAPPAATEPVPPAPVPAADLPHTPYQLGARIRGVFVTSPMLSPYTRAQTQMNSWSLGIEFIYRKPKYDVVTSFDVTSIAVDDGNWLATNEAVNPASDSTHFLQFRGVYLISLDVSIIGHTALGKYLELRYGGGVGVGVVTGDVLDTHDSSQCSPSNASNLSLCNPFSPLTNPPGPITGSALEPALKKTEGPSSDSQDNPHRHSSPDKWPAAPVVNVLMGLRVKLPHKFSAQFEIGFRDAIFFGAGAHYSF
jgi:hypothetical protein